MNQDKAREYFSAYHEGTLEPGLSASLERRLRADSGLKAEYDAFAATLASLDGLRHEAVEIPAYLSDRIATRLDAASAAKSAPFWAAWFAPRTARPYYALGLSCTLLFAAIGLKGLDAGEASGAGVTPFRNRTVEPLTWSRSESAVVATFAPDASRVVTVAPEGGEAQEFAVGSGQPLEVTFQNPNRLARRFKVSQGDALLATVAVPGARTAPKRNGSGTLTELASALADTYRLPVILKSSDLGAVVRWNLEGADAQAAAEKSLDGHGHAVMMKGDVLQIGN